MRVSWFPPPGADELDPVAWVTDPLVIAEAAPAVTVTGTVAEADPAVTVSAVG